MWARDYNEIKALGVKQSAQRTADQTAIARFWEARVPTIYLPVVLSVATAPGRELTQNARLLAVATQAMDDELIAVADAKYHYNFWRPITAIRNGDMDGHDATERDASWVPFIDTPMHPEYPCAHCILSATVATVLHAEVGGGAMPTLRTTSPTAPGTERSWTTIEAFMQEVGFQHAKSTYLTLLGATSAQQQPNLVPDVSGVWYHEAAGAAYMFLVVSIKQRYPGHARQAGLIATECPPRLT